MSPEDRRHGTEAGCREHYRHGQKPCTPCLEAHRKANILRQLYPHKCPALGSQRRIRALQALGYGRDRIAAELGYADGGSIGYLMNAETMLVGTAQRISEMYDRLSMTVPIGAGPSRARTWARRNGYAPPLAWDEGAIDDPDGRPSLTYTPPRRNRLRSDLLAELEHLLAAGESIDQAAKALGVTVGAVEKALERERAA